MAILRWLEESKLSSKPLWWSRLAALCGSGGSWARACVVVCGLVPLRSPHWADIWRHDQQRTYLTMPGPDGTRPVISGGGVRRIFRVEGTLELEDVEVVRGSATGVL